MRRQPRRGFCRGCERTREFVWERPAPYARRKAWICPEHRTTWMLSRFRGSSTRVKLRKEADDLWSKIVRRSAICLARLIRHPLAPGQGPLQAAHGFPKGAYPATRYDLANGFPLCAGCHRYYTQRWEEWRDFMLAKLGDEQFAQLRERALSPARKLDMAAIVQNLRRQLALVNTRCQTMVAPF